MINITSVSKRFRLYQRPLDRVLEWAGMRGRHRDFWALRNIDMHVPRGHACAIIGPNGAGKSTLLKLITGTLVPTAGRISVEGRIAALLELGTGFHPEFTGRQNIYINGQLLGLSHDEIAGHEQAIIDFSELGPFIEQPIRTYSSGMVVRLGFAIAAAVNPQVLIVDEALSVGDARFSQKCIRRIREFREHGCTILFVSHDPHAVSTLCDDAILLDQGQVAGRGSPADVLEHYNALLAARGEGNVEMKVHWVSGEQASSTTGVRRSGTFHAVISNFEVLDSRDRPTELFAPGAVMRLRTTVLFLAPLDEPTVGFMIKDRLGVEMYGTNTALRGVVLGHFEPGESTTLTIDVPLELGDGEYSITVAVHSDETHLEACYDWADQIGVFRVRSTSKPDWTGRVCLESNMTATRGVGQEGAVSGALAEVFAHVPDPLPATGIVPSPFLRGFWQPEIDNQGREFRWSGASGTFVFRPRASRFVVGLAVYGRGKNPQVTLRLKSHQRGELGSVRLREEYALAEFLLPVDSLNRSELFELHVDPPFRPQDDPGRELGVAIYLMRTLTEWEELPPWPGTNPNN